MKTIDIFGPIGEELDGVTAASVAAQIEGHVGELAVRINSPGGLTYEGVAIYNLLEPMRPAVKVVGQAASAASVVAMAGASIEMAIGSRMMIHGAWMLAGAVNEQASAQLTQRLRMTNESIVAIYARRTGKPPEEIAEMLTGEVWMSAAEAVERGFATTLSSMPAAAPTERTQEIQELMRAAATKPAAVAWKAKQRLDIH